MHVGRFVHHTWPGFFFGLPKELKGLWTRPGDDSDGLAVASGKVPEVERARMMELEKKSKSESLRRAFWTRDLSEPIRAILRGSLGSAGDLHAQVVKGDMFSSGKGDEDQTKKTAGAGPPSDSGSSSSDGRPVEQDLRRFHPRSEFHVLGRKKQEFYLQPFRNQRSSDLNNSLRMATLGSVDKSTAEHIFEPHPDTGRQPCVDHLIKSAIDNHERKVLQTVKDSWDEGRIFTALRSGKPKNAPEDADAMRRTEEARQGLDGDDPPEILSRASFDGTFFKAEPVLNGDGSESLALQIAVLPELDWYSERFPTSAEYRAMSPDEKANATIKSKDFHFRKHGAMLRTAFVKVWADFVQAGPEVFADMAKLEKLAAPALFSRCFSLSALPGWLQESLRSDVGWYYARESLRAHTPEAKKSFPGSKYRIGPHHFQDHNSVKLGLGLSPFVLTDKEHEWKQSLRDVSVINGTIPKDSEWNEPSGKKSTFRRRLTRETREKKVFWNTVFLWDGVDGSVYSKYTDVPRALAEKEAKLQDEPYDKGNELVQDGVNGNAVEVDHTLNQYDHFAMLQHMYRVKGDSMDDASQEHCHIVRTFNAEVVSFDTDDSVPGVSMQFSAVSSLEFGMPRHIGTVTTDLNADAGNAVREPQFSEPISTEPARGLDGTAAFRNFPTSADTEKAKAGCAASLRKRDRWSGTVARRNYLGIWPMFRRHAPMGPNAGVCKCSGAPSVNNGDMVETPDRRKRFSCQPGSRSPSGAYPFHRGLMYNSMGTYPEDESCCSGLAGTDGPTIAQATSSIASEAASNSSPFMGVGNIPPITKRNGTEGCCSGGNFSPLYSTCPCGTNDQHEEGAICSCCDNNPPPQCAESDRTGGCLSSLAEALTKTENNCQGFHSISEIHRRRRDEGPSSRLEADEMSLVTQDPRSGDGRLLQMRFELLPVSIGAAGKQRVDRVGYRLFDYERLLPKEAKKLIWKLWGDFDALGGEAAVERPPAGDRLAVAYAQGKPIDDPDKELTRADLSSFLPLMDFMVHRPPRASDPAHIKPRDENETFRYVLRQTKAPEPEHFPPGEGTGFEQLYEHAREPLKKENNPWSVPIPLPFGSQSQPNVRPPVSSPKGPTVGTTAPQWAYGAPFFDKPQHEPIIPGEIENFESAAYIHSVQWVRAMSGVDMRTEAKWNEPTGFGGSHGLDGAPGQNAGNIVMEVRSLHGEGRMFLHDGKNGAEAGGSPAAEISGSDLGSNHEHLRRLETHAAPRSEWARLSSIENDGGRGVGGQIGGVGDNATKGEENQGDGTEFLDPYWVKTEDPKVLKAAIPAAVMAAGTMFLLLLIIPELFKVPTRGSLGSDFSVSLAKGTFGGKGGRPGLPGTAGIGGAAGRPGEFRLILQSPPGMTAQNLELKFNSSSAQSGALVTVRRPVLRGSSGRVAVGHLDSCVSHIPQQSCSSRSCCCDCAKAHT